MLQNSFVALLFGLPLSVVLLVPVAAVLYRREGRIAPAAVLQLLLAAVYFCALWAYTLLPTPSVRDLAVCASPQLRPFAAVGDVLRLGIGSPGAVLHNAAVLQIVLNIALFVPMGVGVRLLLHRGVAVAAVIGLGASLIIEVTQLTGIYGIYSCAYRLFDVDDLIANGAGAVLGSITSAALVRPRREQAADFAPIPVSVGRRLLGLVADAVAIGLLQVVLTAAWGAWAAYGGGPDPDTAVLLLLIWGLPALIELALVLAVGRTAGELLVLIRNEPGTGARWRQALFGATGYCLLGPATVLQGAFVLATLVAVVATRDRRGLSRLLSGGRIVAAGRDRGPQARSGRPEARDDLPARRTGSR